MVCRAPNPAVGSCALGQNTGQQLSYDAEGRLSGWQNVPGGSPNATASFRYDGEGERVAQQSTSSGGGTTTTTRYLLGGLEELTTVGSTSTLSKYYSVPGVVTAIKVGTTLSYLATDGLGSVSVALASAGATAGQALYLPYGAGRYASGSLPTARGYTGQYQDTTSSGLDYYGARYYDPALGQFTSADTVLAGGLNRYAYVGGNPTTATDPSGHMLCFQCMYGGGGNDQGWSASWQTVEMVDSLTFNVIGMYHDVRTILNSKASGEAKWAAAADLLISLALDALMFTGEGEAGRAGDAVSGPLARAARTDEKVVGDLLQAGDDAAHAGDGLPHGGDPHGGDPHGGDPHGGDPHGGDPHGGGGDPHGPSTPPSPVGGCGESFAPDTLVETPSGARPISRLRVGDAVEAYDPATGTTSVQTVQHVFINHDTDRLDVTLAVTGLTDGAADGDGGAAGTGTSASTRRVPLGVRTANSDDTDDATDLHLTAMGAAHRAHRVRQELIHTTASHPWLTADAGWIRAGTLHVGERVVRADGSSALVVGLRAVAGAGDMWDLTVSTVHTFLVGAGQFVVHNCPPPPGGSGGRPPTHNVHGGNATPDIVLGNAIQWLGVGYREIYPGVFRSADGLRQFRMTASDLLASSPHVHFEAIGPDLRWIIENSHVSLI